MDGFHLGREEFQTAPQVTLLAKQIVFVRLNLAVLLFQGLNKGQEKGVTMRCSGSATNVRAGNAHSFIKVRGSITVPSTSCNTGLDMAIFEINKNFSLEAS